jgi:hypothetical protein
MSIGDHLFFDPGDQFYEENRDDALDISREEINIAAKDFHSRRALARMLSESGHGRPTREKPATEQARILAQAAEDLEHCIRKLLGRKP